jgi:hypothetical protein
MAEEFSLEHIWGRKLAGIDLASDVFRPFKQSDVEYLINKYPFIQVVNTTGLFEDVKLEFITAQSGWKIFYYGDALATSPGEFLFGGGDYTELLRQVLLTEEETSKGGESSGGMVNPGKGTIFNQIFDTASDIVSLIMKYGWGGIEIVDGTAFMKAALWAVAKASDVYIEGYTPTEEDEKRLKRLEKRIKVVRDIAKSREFAISASP